MLRNTRFWIDEDANAIIQNWYSAIIISYKSELDHETYQRLLQADVLYPSDTDRLPGETTITSMMKPHGDDTHFIFTIQPSIFERTMWLVKSDELIDKYREEFILRFAKVGIEPEAVPAETCADLFFETETVE